MRRRTVVGEQLAFKLLEETHEFRAKIAEARKERPARTKSSTAAYS
jgi:hypothetical protein